MFDHPLNALPGQVETVEFRIALFQRQQNPHGLLVVIETAEGRHRLVQGALTGVAERRVAKVMGQRQSLGQILVQTQRAGD